MLTPSQHEVLRAIKRCGSADVEGLAAQLGVSISTVRSHLRHLRAAGMVDYALVGEGPGRRRHAYRLTRQAEAHFATNSGWLLRRLVGELAKRDDAWLRDFLAEAGADMLGAREDEPGTFAGVLEVLAQRGYLPGAAEHGRVALGHCPWTEVVHAYPAFCDLEEANLRALLPCHDVHLVARRPGGAPLCVLEVRERGHAEGLPAPTPATTGPHAPA